jgi:hypothetical protein
VASLGAREPLCLGPEATPSATGTSSSSEWHQNDALCGVSGVGRLRSLQFPVGRSRPRRPYSVEATHANLPPCMQSLRDPPRSEPVRIPSRVVGQMPVLSRQIIATYL